MGVHLQIESNVKGSENVFAQLKSFLLALVLFLPTTVLMDSTLYLLFIPVSILYRKELALTFSEFLGNPFSIKYLKSFWLILVLLIGIGVNSIFGGISIRELIMSPVLLVPLTFLAAYIVTDIKVLRWLLVLISLEIIIGCVQYLLGLNSFFTWLPKFYEFINYESLYHTRVFGISENSPYLAQKSLLGVLLLLFFDLKTKRIFQIALMSVFLLGIIVTFGRTTIVVLIFSFFIYFLSVAINAVMKKSVFRVNKDKGVLILTTLFTLFVLFTLSFWVRQFTRLDLIPRFLDDSAGSDVLRMLGLGNMDMAGRRELWAKAIEFIWAHPLFGNNSIRFFVDNKHVHNSFLEYIATNGTLLFMLIFLFIVLHINRRNILFVGSILLYSIGQFGILWDISFLDIVFIAILCFGDRIFEREAL